MRSTNISPVLTSTSTSANCALNVFCARSSAFGKRIPLPITVLLSTLPSTSPSGVRAPLLTIAPASSRSSAFGVSSTPAAAPSSCSRASCAASRTAGPTDARVIEPADIGPNGPVLSPICTRTSSSSTPSSSAQICARTVRVPVPMSCVPAVRTTEPSGSTCTVAYAGGPPPPPQICDAMPMPRRR